MLNPIQSISRKPLPAILLIGLFTYCAVLFNGFVWDDFSLLIDNPLAKSLQNIPLLISKSNLNPAGSGIIFGSYYRPVQAVLLAIIYSIFGPTAFVFHLTQLLLHISNVILIFLILKNFFNKHLSLFLSLLFLLHPINAEAVVYISAYQDLLFVFFGLLSLYTLIFLREKKFYPLLFSLFLFLSVLSKETGVIFIPIALSYLFLFRIKQLPKVGVSIAATAAIYLITKFLVYGHYYQKIEIAFGLPFSKRVIGIPGYILYYLKTFLFPKDLLIAQYWSSPASIYKSNILEISLLVLLIGSLILLLFLFRKKGSDAFKKLLFFSIWFCLGIGIHSQIFQLDMSVSDRWFYLPFIGLIGIIGAVFGEINLKQNRLRILYALGALYLILISSRTFIRVFNWRNSLTLYQHDIKASKNNFYLENNLGVELLKEKKFDEAKVHLIKSVQLYPGWAINTYSLGLLYANTGEPEKAGEMFQKSYVNSRGSYLPAVINYAITLLNHEPPVKAEEFASESLKRYPGHPELYKILLTALEKEGKQKEALETARSFYEKYPNRYSKEFYMQQLQKNSNN